MGTVVDSTLAVKPKYYFEIAITHNIMVLVEENLAPPTFVVGNSFNQVSAERPLPQRLPHQTGH